MIDIVLAVHVLAASAWIGGGLMSAITPNMIAKHGGDSAVAALYRTLIGLGTRLFAPAAVVLLVTGIELVRAGGYSYGHAFVILGIIAVVVGGVLGSAFYAPNGEKIASALDDGDSATAQSTASRFRLVGRLDLALLVVVVFAMVTKLGS